MQSKKGLKIAVLFMLECKRIFPVKFQHIMHIFVDLTVGDKTKYITCIYSNAKHG